MRRIYVLTLLIICVAAANAFASGPESFSDIYKKTKDAVVNISTTKVVKRSRGQSPEDLFRKFFW